MHELIAVVAIVDLSNICATVFLFAWMGESASERERLGRELSIYTRTNANRLLLASRRQRNTPPPAEEYMLSQLWNGRVNSLDEASRGSVTRSL